jgi:ATP-dependent Clp protease ATP-binding subunit ClpC
MNWIVLLLAFVVGYVLAWWIAGADRAAAKPDAEPAEAAPAAPTQPTAAALPEPARKRLDGLLAPLRELASDATRPEDLLAQPAFNAAVALLASQEFSAEERAGMTISEDLATSVAAWAAMAAAGDGDRIGAARLVDRLGLVPLSMALRHFAMAPSDEINGEIVKAASPWWSQYPASRNALIAYFTSAAQQGALGFGDALRPLNGDRIETLRQRLGMLRSEALAPYLAALERIEARRHLEGIGRLRVAGEPAGGDDAVALKHPALDAHLQALLDHVTSVPPRLLLVHGERGVGKTTAIRATLTHLLDEGWSVFECGASDLLAGQMYIGQIEGRLQQLMHSLRRWPKLVWYVPAFHELLEKGRHRDEPRGLLDHLLNFFDSGALPVLGESDSAALAHVIAQRPALRRCAVLHSIAAIDAAASEQLGLDFLAASGIAARCAPGPMAVVSAASALVRQFLPQQQEPGRLLTLLRLVATQATATPEAEVNRASVIEALSRATGLPADMLDESHTLDLGELAGFFQRRVMGQPEAVEAIVDRIALLKSGLSDPGRPIGVFLFAGPTGSGKTELAKALASLLFGDEARMVRLDMSEYSGDGAAARLLGDHERESESRSLLARVRSEPFCVVLLDEFEKAHPQVWDLFLQVFDDGRLSDRNGNTADFRHAIIILTSNVGATISRRPAAGFTSASNEYSRAQVEQALFSTFRREFLNRLDRILVFNPLSRAVLREVAMKELERALQRRGLRDRGWLVQFEPSAIEFLLDRGYTPDLGARPLKRAIETELLTPLSRAIVERKAPAGEQFLFVRAAGHRLEVEFVDPDAGQPAAADVDASEVAAVEGADLRDLVRDPARVAAPEPLLRAAVAALANAVAAGGWQRIRDEGYARMAERDFWNRADRAQTLDLLERIDRVENAVTVLAERVERAGKAIPQAVLQSCAQLAWLAGLAVQDVLDGVDGDAEIEVAAADAPGARETELRAAWRRVVDMYQAWATRRNFRSETVQQDAAAMRLRLRFSGFGAYALLRDESGLHSFEGDDAGAQRAVVRVSVWRQGEAPAPASAVVHPHASRVTRRYREQPAPLVRDLVRGFRSGHLERVLAGEFDVMR